MPALRQLVIVLSLGLLGSAPVSGQTPADALAAEYERVRPALAVSPFGQPLLLTAAIGERQAEGEVVGELNASFTTLAAGLSRPEQWCTLAILHLNIKACVHGPAQVRFYVGSKEYQSPDAAFPLQYRFQTPGLAPNYLSIALDAPDGPFGTRDYRITLEAIPLDERRSFIRFRYAYRFGTLARLAMTAYLATKARNKVGFTVSGRDEQGQPVYVQGLQGVEERNVMRYLIAIQSVLEDGAADRPPFEAWYAHTMRYERQLKELEREEYLTNKQRELENQLRLQRGETLP